MPSSAGCVPSPAPNRIADQRSADEKATSSATARAAPGKAVCEGARRVVRCGRARRDGAEQLVDRRVQLDAVDRLDRPEFDPLGRQRPGLVAAERVDPAHRLDRALALGEGPKARDAHGCGAVRHGQHQREALRDEGHEDGRGEHGVVRSIGTGRLEREDDDEPGEDDEDGDGDERPRDVALERRPDVTMPLGLGQDPVGERLRADGLDLVAGRAAQHGTAGHDLVADGLVDRVGLAREGGFIDGGGRVADDPAVELDLVAAVGDARCRRGRHRLA